jgi:hypothetical protein
MITKAMASIVNGQNQFIVFVGEPEDERWLQENDRSGGS